MSTGWNQKLRFESKGGMVEGKVYGKTVEGFRTDWSRCVFEYKDFSMDDWMQVYTDWEAMLNEDPQYKEVRVVERDSKGEVRVFYCRLGLGMFMTDRDVLMDCNNHFFDDGRVITTLKSTQHSDYP